MRPWRYLLPTRIARAFTMFRVWRSMPRRIATGSLHELLPSLDPHGPTPAAPPEILEEIGDLAQFIAQRAHLPVDNTCMPRSMTLYHCLRREGVPVQLVFGVRPGRSIEEGHAWLELDGQAILEPEHRRRGFAPIFRYPETTREITGEPV